MIEINQACVSTGCFAGDAPGFPVRISEPGSYRLTSNVDTGAEIETAIEIQSDRVTLDLNGFSAIGPQTCSYDTSTDQVSCQGSAPFAHYVISMEGAHNTLRNGTVAGGFSTGTDLRAPGPYLVERVHFTQNGSRGLLVRNGVAALVRHSVSSVNTGEGFQGSTGVVRFESNFAFRNGLRGFVGGVCSGNTSAENLIDYQSCADLGGNAP